MVFGLALAGGLASTRLMKLIHLPNVTGFLIVGLLIGPYCFDLITISMTKTFNIITTAALGFIAFSIGSEFKLVNLKKVGKKAVVITICESLGAVILVDAALIAIGIDLPLAISLGAIAAATAPAATLMVVRQYKAKGPVVDTLLPVVAFDDAVCLMAFSISSSIAAVLVSGTALTLMSAFLKPFLEILLSLVIGAALGVFLALMTKLFKSRANRLSLMLMCVFLAVALAELLNLSSLLVSMMLGAFFVNLRSDAGKILEGCDRWTPPLFMMFFILSGAELNLKAIPGVGLIGIVYISVRVLGKYLGALSGAAMVKAEKPVKKYLGLTLIPQAGVALGMAQLATTVLPTYSALIKTVILSATFIYELIGPVITKLALTRAGEIEKKQKSKNVEPPSVNPPVNPPSSL